MKLPAARRRIYVDRTQLIEGGTPIVYLEGEVNTPIYTAGISILGPSKVVFSPNEPLFTDARVWVETESAVEVVDNGITHA